MGKSKHKLLIILMVAVLAVTACGLLLSACAEEPVKVVLDANGGTFTGGGTTLEIGNLQPGNTLDLSLYAPTREGYTLSQWTDSNQNIVVAGQPYSVPLTARPGSTVTLTAQWSGNSSGGTSAVDILNAIVGGLTSGDNLHSEYTTTLTVPDGSGGSIDYSIQYASNVKRGIINQGEYDYDLGLVIRNETENKGIVGLYITDEYGVPGGLYVDTNPDDTTGETGSVYLLEDFNSDYLLALIEKMPSVLPDTINGLVGGLDIFDLLFSLALGATGSITPDGNGNTVYTMSFNPTTLTSLGGLISGLGSAIPFLSAIDLAPLFSYLEDIIPDSTFSISGTMDSSGNLISIDSSFTNHETGEVSYDLKGGTIVRTDRNDESLSLIPSKVQNYANTYSFGHIQLSAGVTLDTLGAPRGQVDVAALINTFKPGTLPEGVLMLEADLDYRLDLAIDLDIAQKPYSQDEQDGNIKDESVIAVEIKDTKNNDKVIAGVYYREGYLYVNIGQIAEGLTGSAAVWNGKGFAIPFDLPELIKNIKEVAVDFLDEFFGTDHGQITGETDLTKAEGAVVGLALAQDGNVYISQDWANLFITIFQVLKIENASDWVSITQGEDYDSLNITIDKALIDSVLTAISGFGVNTSGITIPDFGTGTISFTSGSDGLRDISVGLALNGLDLGIKFDTLELLKPIEKGDTSFAEYVDGVLGDKSQYTSNLNDLVASTLAAGLKGSIGLDISFNEGTYNLGDLLSVFGLDLGDLKIEVQNDADLDLSLNAGLYIDETDYKKSAMYLQLYANKAFSLGSADGGNIIEQGVVVGLYLYENEVILDASGLKILNVELPVYKITPDDFDMAALIASLLAAIPDNDLAIDLSGVIDSINPGGEAAVASLAGGGELIRSSTRVDNNDLINITVNNSLLQATATLSGVLNLLSSLGLNIDFDASQFLQGEAVIEVKVGDGALTASVSGDLLTPEEGGSSGLNATLNIDLANDWHIGGDIKTDIKDTIKNSLPDGWESADDALLDGLLDQLFNSTLELSVTLPDASTGIANLVGEIIGLIPGVDVSVKDMLESIDLGIGTDEATLRLAIELWKTESQQIIKLGITFGGEAVAEILLNEKDALYVNLDYFGLGRYVVTDSGLYTMLMDLLATLSEDLSLGSLLGGLVDFSGNLNFRAYTVEDSVMLVWNKYGAASSVYYKVYSGSDANGTPLFDTGAADASGFTFDEATGVYTAQVAAAESYFIQVYTKLNAASGQSATTEQVLFDASAKSDEYKPAAATANYQTIDSVTFTWQAANPFGAAETYQLADANGAVVSDLAGAVYDASTFTYTVSGINLTDKTGPFTIRVNGADTYTNIVPVQGKVSISAIEVSLNEAAFTATWQSVDGADHYVVTFADATGTLWQSTVAANGKRYSNIMWGGAYSNYTVTVEAYDAAGKLIASGSTSSSASGSVMDAVTTLLSALSIKGNLIYLNATRDIIAELISTLTGGGTITLVDASITDLDIFNGSANLTIGIYEDASVDDGKGYNIKGSIALKATESAPAVTGEVSDYKELSLMYGANLVESITSVLSDGLSVEAELNIDLEQGAYNVSEIIGPFLPDDIAEYLGDELTWTIGTKGKSVIKANLGVYAALDETDINKSGFMVQISFPDGVSLSGTGDGEVVDGNGFIIKKGAAITVAVSQNTLVVDLSAITILGITLPVYKVENFNMGEFVEGYLVQLERTVANLFNDGNGMLYLPESSNVTADADSVDFTVAFDYIGNGMTFDTVYGTKDGETAITGVDHNYDIDTTIHTISGSHAAVAKAGDYIAIYAKDTNGNRYDCLKLTAREEGGSIVFSAESGAAQAALATTGLNYDNYLTIDSSKLQLVITSQTIFSLLSLVADIPANVSSMDFDVTVGMGEQTAGAEKSLWVTADGTFGGKKVIVSLDAGIGIGGTVSGNNGEVSIAQYITEQYRKVQAEGNDYPTRLIAGILDEVLTSTVTLSLTADAAEKQGFDLLGVAKQMVGGIVNLGDTALELVAQQNDEPVRLDLVLALDGAMTKDNVKLNMISLKLNYVTVDKTTTLIGIYVCDGNLWLDLSGIGMGAVKVEATEVINKLTGYLGSLVGGFDIDLATILDRIAEGGTYPYGNAATQSLADGDTSGDATSGGDTSGALPAETANVIKALITLVSVENANIKLEITKDIINELLSLVDTVSMSLNASASGYLDIFAGKAEIDATIYDGPEGDAGVSALNLKLALGIKETAADAADALRTHIGTLSDSGVEISLDNMNKSVANLLNSLSAKLNLKVTTAELDQDGNAPTTDIWELLGPILDSVLVLDNQNVINALEAIKNNGVDWTIDPTTIDLDLALASDIKLTESGEIDIENSVIAVGIIANEPLVLGTASDTNKALLDKDEGIYITIYGGSLYIDLSQLNLLDIELPVLKVGTFEVMKYIEEVAGIIGSGIEDMLEGLDDATRTQQLAAVMALANGQQTEDASLELGSDLTLSVALSAITQILKDTSIIDLTALDLPWEIVLTTATGGAGQLQLQLNNTSETPSGVNLEADLTLSAAFEKRDPAGDDVRNDLLAYVNGGEGEGNVAERYAGKSGDLIAEVINSVLSSRLTLELGADSDGDTFDLRYALNGLLGLLGMDKIDTELAFNLDTSAEMKYRLNLILDGQSDDLSAVNAYIGIEMASGKTVTEENWKTAIGIYLSEGEIYVDLSAIRKGALGGGVLKVANSAIMELFETEINKLLSNINLDLNELLTLNYKPINPPVVEVSTAPSLTVNEMPVGTLVSYLIQMVSLKNLGVALDAHTTLLKDFTRELFGYAIDFVEAEGNLLLVDGKLDLSVKIGSGKFADDTVTEEPGNVYTLGAVLDISRGTDISDKITAVKEKPTTEIDLSNGASLADSIMDLLGNVSLDLNVDLSLPGGVFGIGDLLNNFGLVDGGLTDANGLDLIFEPLYKDDSTDAPQGGMQLGLTLSLRLSLDAQKPENSLGAIKLTFNKDMIMGTTKDEDGTIQNKVLFRAGTDFLNLIIAGNDLYVDLSDLDLLGITMPKYHTSNFDITGFVDYVLGKALDNTESVIYGGHGESSSDEGGEGDVSTANLAQTDGDGNWTGLSANEAMFIGVTQNDIVAMVSFTAVEAFLNLFGMNADLGNYDATIDLTISRDENNPDWMKLHFVGQLDDDMYYEGAETEGTVSISNVAIGGKPDWTEKVRAEAEEIAQGAADAGHMLIEGIIDQVLNLSASLKLELAKGSETYISLASILGYIFDQTGIEVDLSEILLDLEGLSVQLDVNLDVDPDSREDSAATIEIKDTADGGEIKLIGIYLKGYELVIDLSGISLGRFAVTRSAIPDLVYDIVYDLIAQIRDIDIDLDTIVEQLYNLVDEAFSPSTGEGDVTGQNLAVPDINVTPGVPLSGNGFTQIDGQYVTVTDNGDGTTTFTWSRYPAASYYMIQLYNGYDNSKANLIDKALADSEDAEDLASDEGLFVVAAGTTSITVKTEVLNNVGWLADATSKYNGAEFPSYYVFVVRAGSMFDAEQSSFTPITLGGQDVYASTSNNTLLKTILGMVKIRNGAIEVDARAVMVDKLLRGVLGVSFDWASANVGIDIVDGSAGISIDLSDGDPEQYVATEETAKPDLSDDGTTLTYTWTLTAEQAENVKNYRFQLREKAGDTATYGKLIELNSSDVNVQGAAWTLPTQENGYTLTLAITVDNFAWLSEAHRGNADGVTTTNLAMAQEGLLPLRLTAEYDVNTVSLTGEMNLGANGEEGAAQALTGVYTVDDEGVYTLAEDVQIIDLYNNASLLTSVKKLLDGFKLEAELAIYVAEGRYDMGALIADILTTAGVGVEGLDEVTSLFWEITSPFKLNLRLQLLIEYGTSDEDMRIALTIDTDGLYINEDNIINPGILLGLYYTNGKALLDLTNFKLAGITLPAYTIDVKLYDLVNNAIEDIINGLDISSVSGEGAQQGGDETTGGETSGDVAEANLAPRAVDEITAQNAIVLGISSEEIALRASFSAVATLLSTALSGNETVATIAGVLEGLDLSLGASMKRDQDLTLTLSGMLNWAPLTGEGEFTQQTAESSSVTFEQGRSTSGSGSTTLVYSFAPVAGASEYTAVLKSRDGSLTVDGTVKNGYASFTHADLTINNASSDLYIVTVTGVIDSPVNMQLSLGTAELLGADQEAIKGELEGMLGAGGSVNFEERVNEYGDLLLTGLIDTLLNTRISLAIDLSLIEKQLEEEELAVGGTISLSDIVLAIAGDILVSAGLTLDDLLGSVDVVFDMDVTTIILDIAMNMDLDNPEKTDLVVQLKSDIGGVQDVLLGLYVYDNLLTVDLRALGLRAYTLRNFDYIVNLQTMLRELLFGSEATGDTGLLGQYDIDLSETIDGLLNPATDEPGQGGESDPGTGDQPSAGAPVTETPEEIPTFSVTARNDANAAQTTLSWPAVEGAHHYEAIATDVDGEVVFHEQNLSATSYTYAMKAGLYDVTIEAHSADYTVLATGSRQMNGAIASILSAVSLQNTIVQLEVTPQIINNLLAAIAPDISINAEPINVNASVDIFNGDANASVDINLKYEQPVGDTTFRLGAELSIKTAEELYDGTEYSTIAQILAELGTDVDEIDFGSNATDDAGVDAARITYAILDALNTTGISANLNISFNKGTYDIGAMLSGMGIEALDGVSLLWTFDEAQDIALKLELGMFVDTQGLTGTESLGTWFLLDITAQSEIRLGNVVVNNSDMGAPYVIAEGTKIISIYGKEESGDSAGTVYVDLSNLHLLGLELPVISAQYKFTDLLINEFYNIICSIMDLNSYLEATYTVTTDEGGVPTTLTFGWDEVTLGDSAVSPEVYYDVTVVGKMANGMTSTIYTQTIQTESVSFDYGDIEMFEGFDVTVVSYFNFNGERRVLGEYTTNITLNSSNAIEEASYVTPDDVYAENTELARVEGVTWTWTDAGVARVTWQPYEGATAYLVSFRRASDGEALTQTCDFAVDGAVTSYTTPDGTSGSKLFSTAKGEFDATHPMMGAGFEYGYIAEVYAYTDEELAEEGTLTTDILKGYSPAAVGAANSFADMNMWFAPLASQYGGATSDFYVGWSSVEGAANYSVLPYRILNEVEGGTMTTSYPVVGLTSQGGTGLTATELMLDSSQLSFSYYNSTYTREYYVETVAYDEFGNMIARGQMNAAMGKITDDEKTLLPVSTIALVLDSERFGLEVQLNAVLAILEDVGVELPIDLRGFDVAAALGLDTTIGIAGGNNVIQIATDENGDEDVDGFKLNGLADGSYTLAMTYTNSGGVRTQSNMSFTVSGGNYQITSGDYSIENGFVNYGMRRNGTYEIVLGGTANASAVFTVSRTINLGISGDITLPVSGADDNFSLTVTDGTGGSSNTVGVTNDGRTLFWQPVAGASTYTVNVVKTVDGEQVANETFAGLNSFVQKIDFTEAGVYTVTVTAFNAADEPVGTPQKAIVTVKGDSGLNISISIPYDGLSIGAATGQEELSKEINNRIDAVGNDNHQTVLDLLQTYLSDFNISLSLGIESFTTEINLQTIINSLLSALGVTTEIGAPIYINTDDISAMGVTLNVGWHIDWDTPTASYAMVELKYTGMNGGNTVENTMLGVYLQNNTVCADLTGVGLIGIKLSSEGLYSFLTNTITDAINGLFDGLDMGEGLDLSTALQMLLGEYPVINLAQITAGNTNAVQTVALADETATADSTDTTDAGSSTGGLSTEDVITGLLNAVSLNSTNVFLSATTAILDEITSNLLGITLGIDVDLGLQIPLLKGSIVADLRLDNITFQGMLTINAMEGPKMPNLDSMNFAVIDANDSGAAAVMALLSNLPLNLTIELANSTMDSSAYYNVSNNNDWLGHATYPAGTRINVEVINGSSKTYGSNYNLQTSFTADPGDIVVTVASTDEAEQNSTGSGHLQYFIVVHIDISAGQISVKLCRRAIVLQATALLGIEAEIDLGGGVTILGGASINIAAIPLNINIPLDLAETLGSVFDTLLSTINGLSDTSSGGTSTGSGGGNTSSGTGETVDPYDVAVSATGDGESDAVQQGEQYQVHFNGIMNETAWDETTLEPTKWQEAYDRYIITVSRADGSIVDRAIQEVSDRPIVGSSTPTRYTVKMNANYYESYNISITGEADPTGFSAALADIDIWKLLGGGLVKGYYDGNGDFVPTDNKEGTYDTVVTTTGGIYMNLNSTGEMNLTVRFDPYEMNKAVDAIFGSIFGANSALDLTTVSLGSGYFGINYLMYMWWDRATASYERLSGEPNGNEDSHDTRAEVDPNSTLDSLNANLRGLLADLLQQMNIAVDQAGVLVSAAALRDKSDTLQWARWDDSPWGLTPVLLSIFMKFVPISIWTSAELNVNMSNGVLTNISFMGHDDGSAVLRYNEETDANDVYVYYAKTLFEGSSGDDGSGNHGLGYYLNTNDPNNTMESNVNYNVTRKNVGYNVNGETKTMTYHRVNSSTEVVSKEVKVYTYAIPYGSVVEGTEYYYDDVVVATGTGKDGGSQGYGGYSNGSGDTVIYKQENGVDGSLYKRGGYDENGVPLYNSNPLTTRVQNKNGSWFTLNSYTRIEIYNTGDNVNAANAGTSTDKNEGIVSWGNLPNRIVFDQYSMGWNTQAASYLYETYFGNVYTARWQKGTSFARANVTFTLNGEAVSPEENGNLAKALGIADPGESVIVVATARFSNGEVATLNIAIEKCDIVNDVDTANNGKDEAASVDAWNLYYYDELPEYIIMTTNRGERKRYKVVKEDSADARSGNYDATISNYQTDSAGFAQSDVVEATLTFKNKKKVKFNINYMDSTLVNPTVSVDMNNLQTEYDEQGQLIDVTTKISNAIQNLMVYYADGSVLTNGAGITWGGAATLSGSTQITGSRYINEGEQSITLDEWISRFSKSAENLQGDTFYIAINVDIDAGLLTGGATADKFTQELTVIVDIPTKEPQSISVHGSAANTVVLNPYDYYMYLVTGSDSNNPLPSAVDVTYENGISESVSVMWRDKGGNFITADEFVSNWYTVADNTMKFYLENDETRYSFRWENYEMSVQINSGVISSMQFLVDGQWRDSVPADVTSTTARVTFTSGYVLELPTVIRLSMTGYGYAYIGYDVATYNATGALVEYEGCNLKQAKRIRIEG